MLRSFQMLKSQNYVYKVCSGTNYSLSYCSDSSFKALSFGKKISTLNSDAIDKTFDLRNRDQFPGTESGYGKDWSSRESNIEYSQNPNGFYRETSMGFQRNFNRAYGQSYNMGDHGLHRHRKYNVIGSYIGNASRNQKSSLANFQISNRSYTGMVNSQLPCYSQPNEKLYKAGEEKGLIGTIEELNAFCKDQKLEKAVEVLGLLELNKVSVEMHRYLFLMKACGESQALKEAKQVHNHLTRSAHHLDVHICNKILEMYSKCGSMEDAYKLFDKMPQRNLTSWDTMITWLAKNGHGEDAIDMFTEFKKVGLKPDNQMFHGVFAACSVVGDMIEGLLHLESMIKTYNLVPSIDDYVHVVDMLGSSGYLNEALEFIENMPFKPSVEIWEIMMNQSRVHGDLELGDRCAEIVNLLDPSRLDEQSKEGFIPIKPSDIAKEKENERKKSSAFDLKVFQYRAGDTSHPNHETINSQLRCLKQSMIEAGYVPRTRFVLDDVDHESKEEDLLSHSGRLALSQALLTTPARAQIRIIKNACVCGDCHDALKIISRLVGRMIAVREAKRFHYFENGVCSCRDLW